MKYIIAIGGNELIDPEGSHQALLGDWNPYGKLVKISNEDYDLTSEVWTVFRGSIVSRSKNKSSKGTRYLLQLHRVIAHRMWLNETPFSHTQIVKFKDGDRYNMQRENIMIVERTRSMSHGIHEKAKSVMEAINKKEEKE